MIFSALIEEVIDGTKTQTRRLVKEGDYTWTNINGDINEVCNHLHRRRWQVGNNYAVQPGRGKKGIGRIEIAGIRKENIQDISYEDIGAEGINRIVGILHNTAYLVTGAKDENELTQMLFRAEFVGLWDHLYPKENCWEDNPEVWVLEFNIATEYLEVR